MKVMFQLCDDSVGRNGGNDDDDSGGGGDDSYNGPSGITIRIAHPSNLHKSSNYNTDASPVH